MKTKYYIFGFKAQNNSRLDFIFLLHGKSPRAISVTNHTSISCTVCILPQRKNAAIYTLLYISKTTPHWYNVSYNDTQWIFCYLCLYSMRLDRRSFLIWHIHLIIFLICHALCYILNMLQWGYHCSTQKMAKQKHIHSSFLFYGSYHSRAIVVNTSATYHLLPSAHSKQERVVTRITRSHTKSSYLMYPSEDIRIH